MITGSTRIGDTTVNSQFDTQNLNAIFGYKPQVNPREYIGEMSFDNGQMTIITGYFYEIIGGNTTYTISPSKFSKTIGSSEIIGDGSFDGPMDEIGKKLLNQYFSSLANGSTIYLNGEKRQLLKKESSVELV